ncbi:hypothetical protein [Actinopolymorpha sp. B9G3]|uniref:hypothetical protein n=1 Tax=Actinopolymorpha sp. B9G3 TaxID=3158970 RepID=UPI0032D8EE53
MSPTTCLVYVDETYDRDYASDGASRYGAYLRSRSHLFIEDGEPLDAVSFAALVWRIGCSPIVSPAYVQLRAPVRSAVCRGSENDSELLVAELELRLPWPAGLSPQGLAGVRSWDRDTSWGGSGQLLDPGDDRPALLYSARLVLPLAHGVDLPAPDRACPVNVGLAKQVVGRACRQINDAAAPIVGGALSSWRGVHR